jgi:redox-regulated HSP33 family molecular chaperone
VLLTACVHEKQANKKQDWSEGVVVAMNMCAKDGSVQHTKDAQGKRAYCGQELLVGSHMPKCVCRYEEQSAQQREESQQYMRDAAHTREVHNGN